MFRNISLFEKLDKSLIEIYKEMKMNPSDISILLALDGGQRIPISRKYDNCLLADALKDIANKLIPAGIYIDNVLTSSNLHIGFGSYTRNSIHHFETHFSRASADSLEKAYFKGKKTDTAGELALQADGFSISSRFSSIHSSNSTSETNSSSEMTRTAISDNKEDPLTKKINFHINTMTGKTIVVECALSDKISVIKQRVFEQANIPIEDQIITLDGKKLDNDHVLSDYNYLTERAHLVIRLQQPVKKYNSSSSLAELINVADSSNPIFSTSSSVTTASTSNSISTSLSPKKTGN